MNLTIKRDCKNIDWEEIDQDAQDGTGEQTNPAFGVQFHTEPTEVERLDLVSTPSDGA